MNLPKPDFPDLYFIKFSVDVIFGVVVIENFSHLHLPLKNFCWAVSQVNEEAHGLLVITTMEKKLQNSFQIQPRGGGEWIPYMFIWLEFFEPLPKNFPENSYVCVIRGIQIGLYKYIVIITLSRFESMERQFDDDGAMVGCRWWDSRIKKRPHWRHGAIAIVGWHDGNKAMLYRVFARALLHHSHRVFAPSRYRLLLADVLLEIRMAASLQSTRFSSWDLRSNIYRVYLSNNAACWQH